jgi:hypothetical protein
MPTTDTSEKALESLIIEALVGTPPEDPPPGDGLAESPEPWGGVGYVQGSPQDFDRDHAIDRVKLQDFARKTQPDTFDALELADDTPKRTQFLHRLQGEIAKRGVIDVLRHGVKHGPVHYAVFYGAPTPGNVKAEELFAANIFSVTRQLRYGKDETQLALDLCLFINGLPVATFELKSRLTRQTVEDAVQQYKRDRDPKELLFQFGRCIVHFARTPGSCPSTRVSRTGRATRPIPTASRPPIYGRKSSRGPGSRTSSRTTPRWSRRKTTGGADGRNRSSRATTSLMSSACFWPMPPPVVSADAA